MRAFISSLTLLLLAGAAYAADPGNTVPEPESLALVAAAAVAAYIAKRRKSK